MDVVTERRCTHCGEPLPAKSRSDKLYCDDGCRMAAYRERQRAAHVQLLRGEDIDTSPTQLDLLREAVKEAVREEKLLAVIAAEARQGNWRASAWLLSRMFPERWSERGRDVPFALDGDPADPFQEFDELAERRRRKPPGY